MSNTNKDVLQIVEETNNAVVIVERGQRGATGPTGPQGATGAAGADGADGVDGADGADGTDGVQSDPTGFTGADAVTNVISCTQAEYDAIAGSSPLPDGFATTFFLITDA